MSAATAEPKPIDKSVRALGELEPAQSHIRRRFGLDERDEAARRSVGEVFRPPAWVSGQISIHDAMFLYDIVRGVRPRRIIEIGTASGASAAVLLRAMADIGRCFADEFGEPVVHTFDLHPFCWFDRARPVGSAAAEMAPQLAPGLRIHAHATSADAGRLFRGLDVELAFIDADHRHPGPVADLLLLLPALARGAWVVLHDIALPEIADREEARTGRPFEGRYHGAAHLFNAWPWERVAGGGSDARFGARNIGAIRLPGDRAVTEADLRTIIDRPWEATPEPRALAVLGARGRRARPELRAVGLIAAHGVSGVSSATARLAELEPPHQPWRIMAVGPGADAAGLPGSGSSGFAAVPWDASTAPVDQVRRVRDALRHCRADVVNPNFLLAGFAAAALDRHRGRRIAALWHGSEWAAEDLYERAAPLADAWRAVSPAIAARVSRLLGRPAAPGPHDVLGAAVRVPDFVTPPPCCLDRAAPLRILYAAWLDERSKRVMDLVVLADALARHGVDFRLTIAGRGPAGAKLTDALAGHIAAGRVSMPGPVPLERMTDLHRAHDVLALISSNEGSPVIVMEAMAQGRPVAITRGCGGALDAVRDGIEGIVVDVGEMGAMASRLARMWREPAELARMGISAHAAAKARFDLAAVAERYDALVEEAAQAPTGPHPCDAAAIGALWSRVLAVLEMIGPSRPMELAGLCAEWLADLAPLQTGPEKEFLETAPWLIAVFKLSRTDEGSQVYYINESVGIAVGLLLAAIHHAGLCALTHTPSPMAFLGRILNRPAHERPFLLIPVGYAAPGCMVPDIHRKPVEHILSWNRAI